MEKNWLDCSDIKFLIISRGRSKSITSHLLFPFATLVVPESEVNDYEKCGLPIAPCPDNIKGLSLLRNWCLKNFNEHIVVMIDDDISSCVRVDQVTYKKIDDPDYILQVLVNTAQNAFDIGTIVFGFEQSADVRHYSPDTPFSLSGWVGGIIGVIGKDFSFIDNMFKVDIDFCLEALLHKRVIWKENRIAFVQKRDRNCGGNSIFRTKELVEIEKQKLKNKWGGYIKFKSTSSREVCSISVKRKESYSNFYRGLENED